MGKYKIIDPPFSLDFYKMNKVQLKEYAIWFLNIMDERVLILEKELRKMKKYGTWRANYTKNSLRAVGNWFNENVEIKRDVKYKKNMSEIELANESGSNEEWDLSEKTFSMAADVGIYFGRIFIKNNTGLYWEQCKHKTVDFGLLVVAGSIKTTMNPIRLMQVLAYKIAEKKFQIMR